ncbi:hypothetical protein N7462_010622 [Penicillium macrosclerotiorum]|uniref:uncharacterized protein n=1 Tax=Penicillium macrosclerotiorum TaxID=303699 RepID=UPI0025480EC9|nr:uncharacterized protein N7462_010622 [Penicillium macrosclerotiorum]KAJ5669552.1 hypothetical protein N7462_010622 [Penicillium macrosclerotiorum]
MASFFRRVIPARIPNTGSQQRDHHANERTFLSWTRAGLGFAAMALALDRLDAIDRVLSIKLGLGALAHHPSDEQPGRSQSQAQPQPQVEQSQPQAGTRATPTQRMNPTVLAGGFSAARLCQVLGLWSLGYGFFRYWSMRRYLLQGQFVPAFWGPVLMTAGSFGAFITLGLQMDRRHSHAS